MEGAAKSKPKSTDNWGRMAFLLVFFPDDSSSSPSSSPILDSSSSTTTKLSLKRTNSSSSSSTKGIVTKAQSTLSICVLLLFFSLLLFTLSTFEPSLPPHTPRRLLSDSSRAAPATTSGPTGIPGRGFFPGSWFVAGRTGTGSNFALQRMGRLHLRGARAMPDLLVCHVAEDTPHDDFRVFLRLLLRSGFASRGDVVFLFPASSASSKFEPLVREEGDLFLKLMEGYVAEGAKKADGILGFDVGRFLRSGKKEAKEPLWGKKVVRADDSAEPGNSTESTRPCYGSVVSFDTSELDPEDSLAGFLDHVPMSLRRWACYPMLLGRLRRNYKHVALVDVRSLLVLGDPLSRVKNLSGESVYVMVKKSEGKPSKRNSGKTQSRGQVNSALLMGGARGIRRLSTLMLTEIVRTAMQQHKRKAPVTESGVLGQLVANEHVMKNVNVVESAESIPELTGSLDRLESGSRDDHHHYYNVIQRGNSNRELNSVVMKRICACELDSSVYRDCQLALADKR